MRFSLHQKACLVSLFQSRQKHLKDSAAPSQEQMTMMRDLKRLMEMKMQVKKPDSFRSFFQQRYVRCQTVNCEKHGRHPYCKQHRDLPGRLSMRLHFAHPQVLKRGNVGQFGSARPDAVADASAFNTDMGNMMVL